MKLTEMLGQYEELLDKKDQLAKDTKDILPGSIPDALLGCFSSSASAGCLRFRFGLAARS